MTTIHKNRLCGLLVQRSVSNPGGRSGPAAWRRLMAVLALCPGPGMSEEMPLSAAPYMDAVRRFADRVIEDGRDSYGKQSTPLFVDGLHVETLEPVRWHKDGETWVLSNFASQQPLVRVLDGLTSLTGQAAYRQAAEEASRHVMDHLRTPNGLIYWGGHSAWDLEVPFHTEGNHLSFVNVTPSFLHSGVELATLNKDHAALLWTRRLIHRWHQARDPKTGLSGGQLSYRTRDRAREALGHVHPDINEARIVATYHQTGRYHNLPLAQMHAGEALSAAGGKFAEVGREFIQWAAEDLKIYARHCYDRQTGTFIAMMTDGTPIRWQESREAYYKPQSFAPRKPDGALFWGYCLAYRLTGEKEHWQMIRRLARSLGIGDPGEADGSQPSLDFATRELEWQLIYALLELHRATGRPDLLAMAARIGDNLVSGQAPSGLFPRTGREFARTGDEVPLALLHLAAAIAGKRDAIPPPITDRRLFHCKYDDPAALRNAGQGPRKWVDPRSQDGSVFYGDR